MKSYGNLTTMSSDSFAGEHPSGELPRYVGAVLRVVWQWVRDQMYAGVVAAGYNDLNAAHVGLWRYPGLDGLRPSQLADLAGITKQSVNDLLGHLERHGYLGARARSGRRKSPRDPTHFQGTAARADNLRRGGDGPAADRRDPGAATFRPAAQLS